MLKCGCGGSILWKKYPMLQLISPSMVESCISVSVSNPVRAYLAAILKMMWKNVAQSYLADRLIIIESVRRKK